VVATADGRDPFHANGAFGTRVPAHAFTTAIARSLQGRVAPHKFQTRVIARRHTLTTTRAAVFVDRRQ
jgi:hypothetical protein